MQLEIQGINRSYNYACKHEHQQIANSEYKKSQLLFLNHFLDVSFDC